MELQKKLEILSAAAKYDVSCSSSGSNRKNTKGGLGNAASFGICHSWSDDGRCISLLKILLTNYCVYDCAYCVNRVSNDIPRAAFTPQEVANLTINFYRRNYIEGLFLSSAVVKNPNHTMELLYESLRILRKEYRFNGYIHVKAIPGADLGLIEAVGKLADRMSVNIELPSENGLKLLAPQKNKQAILKPMNFIASKITEKRDERKVFKNAPLFVPGGQSTQLIVGATQDHDINILRLSENLYKKYKLKRVYYSAYVPVSKNPLLPDLKTPPLLREHRLYQADWLLRFYGFSADELLDERNPDFDPKLDPKTNWAINNMSLFPVEINRADYEMLLRVPGIGVRSAKKIIMARKVKSLSFEDLKKLGVVLKRAKFFITCNGKYFFNCNLDQNLIRQNLINGFEDNEKRQEWEQISIFSLIPEKPTLQDQIMSITGEI
ncbi:MAG TPA: putative DNA modification/repair radical SAM protein [Hungateiclostridium thermocellum]|uniref:Radical SAM domain-containing protein n=2 Tax=Acetivibrio thermocellus TaxID=1515 RepID=A3DCG6_ACET2|nr:putative DNA modification/repair radical SAM protein [Acetivibrio thermocellus]ABN51645.1 radical SAM domain-containing protein [Acetivibrio thermocellus ATCC 27405]ADU74870.1 radical SAM domain-containing protein [Acetivibrio thermocellus DSM 1313]ALX08825.1 DNA modification/repair radical SAM protein, putative [Acetivibrio thermocellus AD2]ANV76575.1 DNA modification/repair radical SAM protein, putative [Acetivibrio thermocellus DSM 2360]EIC05166.1 radical SAM family protein [Acetivibrio 